MRKEGRKEGERKKGRKWIEFLYHMYETTSMQGLNLCETEGKKIHLSYWREL